MLPKLEDIQKRRKVAGLTQAELAKIARISQSLVAKIEAGKVDPSYSSVNSIVEALEELEHKKSVLARDIMSAKVVKIQKNETVEKAVKLMKSTGISQLPVVEKDAVVGAITEKGILDHIDRGENLETLSKKHVDAIMEEAFPMVPEETSLHVISALLTTTPAILVLKGGKISGIVTKADTLKVFH